MNYASNVLRDAHRTIAGFVFQVNSTILHWLNLESGTFLELESGEDIDVVRAEAHESEENIERFLTQLKQLSDGSLTLRNREALKSVANFCGHRKANPAWKLRFRFVTTLPIGEEREGWDNSPSAIETWERIRRSEGSAEERATGTDALRTFLTGCERPSGFSKLTWTSLEETLSGQALYTFADIVATFEWAAGVGDYLEIKKQICARLETLLPEATHEAVALKFDQLFAFVFEKLCQPGTKRLDEGALQERLTSSAASQEYLAATRTLVGRLEALEERVAKLEIRVDGHDEQLESHQASIEKLEEAQEGSLKTFYPAEEFFATNNPGAALYDLDQLLRGRQSTRALLDQFLSNDVARIAVVEGSGGIGKTKVLRDWSKERTDWETRWTGPNIGMWHPGTPNEIPSGAALVIADDGHRYDDLERLTTLVATWAGPNRLKLVVAVRKSDNNKLRQALSMIDESAITRIPALGPLDHDDVVALAQEVLGPQAVVDPERLARVSADSPFITVVGGRLIAQRRIAPELLNNDREFQRRVFDTLASQYDGLLPSGNYSKSQFMQLISALQPVKESDDSFIEKAGAFLGLKNSEVRRGFTSLDVNGVLKRARKGSSIIPDLLADYLLGLASVEEDGKPTEFANEVFESFEDSHFPNLLKNLAVLDWRIAQRDDGSQLLDKIWARLSERFRGQNASERLHMLRAMEPIAVYLPEKIHVLIRIAMDEPAATSNLYNLYRITQQRVLEALSPFLGVTILQESTGQDAFHRLWQLAQHETEAVRGPAQRALEQAIGYAVNKDLVFNAHVLSIVEAFAKDPAAYDGRFTPLDLLDELMAREIDHTERVGLAFHNSVHTINHKAVESLRQRVFGVIEQCFASDNPRIAYRATKSLSKIVSVFIPMRRDRESAEERVWHDAERNQALGIIVRRLETGILAVSTVWKIRQILQSTAEDIRQSADISERAAAMLGSVFLPELFLTFHVLCTDEWGYNTEADGFVIVSDRRRAEESQAIAELTNRYPDPGDQVRAIELVVRLARASRVDPVSVDSFLSRLCRARDFLFAFSEHLVSNDDSVLRQVAGIAVRAWRAVDKAEYLRYSLAFISVKNDFMVHSVAAELCSGPALQNVTAEDVEIISVLASRSESWILGTIFQALGSLSKPGPFSEQARQLVRKVDIGSDSDLAGAYCQIIGPGPFRVSASSVDLETLRSMAAKLVPVYELEKPHFGEFVAYVCGIIPLEIVDLLERRLEFARTVVLDDQRPLYKPLPSPQHWSSLRAVRQSQDYGEVLRRLFELGTRFPNQNVYLDDFFWRFGTLDETTFRVLDDGIHTDDIDRFRRTLSLLCEAPKKMAFSHPGFALHVLTESELRGTEWGNTAMDILVNNCIVTGGVQAMGPNTIPIGAGVADQARPLMDRCKPGSPLHRLYFRLAQIQPMPIPDFHAELELDENDD